jgi:hypothetical protein
VGLVVGIKEKYKGDECGRSRYKGENIDDQTGKFVF